MKKSLWGQGYLDTERSHYRNVILVISKCFKQVEKNVIPDKENMIFLRLTVKSRFIHVLTNVPVYP